MPVPKKREFHQNGAIVISSIFSKEKEDYSNYRGLNLTECFKSDGKNN